MYDYHTAAGRYLYSKVRFEGKEIRYVTIDRTADSYQYCKKSGQASLYRLPELIRAVRNGYVIYIVEGEKDVETLRSLGYSVTTAGGVNDWRREYTSYFTGARVVILPDNDEPGLRLKDRIMQDLKHFAHSVRWTVTSQKDKGDVTDYLIFYTMRRFLIEKQSKHWNDIRIASKENRLKETGIIKALIEYAKQQGSTHSDKLYLVYTKLTNSMIGSRREEMTASELNTLTLAESIIRQTIEIDMSVGMHYKDIYQHCKERIGQFAEITYLIA